MSNSLYEQIIENGYDVFRRCYGLDIRSCKKLGDGRYEFYDSKGLVMSTKVDLYFVTGSWKMLFYDSLGKEIIGSAYVHPEVLGPRTIAYYDRHGSRVASVSVDEDALYNERRKKEQEEETRRKKEQKQREQEEEARRKKAQEQEQRRRETERTTSPPPSDNDGAGVLVVVALVCILITAAFTALYNHIYMVLRVSSFICVFLPVPLMLYIFIRMCHKKDANEVRAQFFNLQLIMLAAAFVLLSILHFLLFFPHLSPINTGSFGFFLSCFVPCVLHGIGNAFLIRSFAQQHGIYFWEMGDASARIVNVGSMVFIYISQMVQSFSAEFTPGIIESFVFVLLMLMVLAFCAAAGFVASLPYKLLIKLI